MHAHSTRGLRDAPTQLLRRRCRIGGRQPAGKILNDWRECDKSKLIEATTNVCLVVEGLTPFSADDVLRISDKLAELIETHCGGRTVLRVLDCQTPSIEMGDSGAIDRS